MEKASVCLIIVLAFYFLVPSDAIPLSRVQRFLLLQAGEMPTVEESISKQEVETRSFISQDDVVMNARMALEMQDYRPSGPNNHHKPPGWS